MNKKYHFIAIGGIGMSGLAKYLLEKSCKDSPNGTTDSCEEIKVSGSDICSSKYTEKIEKLGAKVYIGHSEDNLPNDCMVVASTAVKEDNPELVKAKRLGLTIMHRSDLLAEISRGENFFIGYSGTHGKTTTSGMAAYVLEKAGLKPSFIVGGIVPEIDTNAKSDEGEIFVAELDESDGTIVKYTPNISVINNLEADHIDFYKDGMKSILKTFETYLSTLKKGSKVLINNDCEGTRQLEGDFITFGLDDADYVAKNVNGCEFDIYHRGEFLVHLKLSLYGKHNVYNALAVAASLNEAGVDLDNVKEHFATFTGMGRRFQLAAEFDGVSVYDDYAHHPTEIKATLTSLEAFQGKNIIAVFQPHRFTRLQTLWTEFLSAFIGVNKVVVTDVYAASEDEIEGVTSEKFVYELSKTLPAVHISGNIEEVAKKLLPTLKSNDVVIGLGAGSITGLGKYLREEFSKIGN